MRFFTLAEANNLLPILENSLRQLRLLKSELRQEWEQLEEDLGSCSERRVFVKEVLQSPFISKLSDEYNRILKDVRVLGVICRSVDQGVFDFPMLLDNELVFLSWKSGESSIRHWHSTEEGFRSRKPLIDAPFEECSRHIH